MEESIECDFPNFLESQIQKWHSTLDHFRKSESPSFDSLNERFYDSDNIPKIFSKNSHGNM